MRHKRDVIMTYRKQNRDMSIDIKIQTCHNHGHVTSNQVCVTKTLFLLYIKEHDLIRYLLAF